MFCVHSGCPASPLPMVARWIFRTPAADGLVHGQTVWLQWLPGSFTTCFLHLYPSDLTSCPTSFHTSTWASCGSLTMTEEIIFHCKLFQDIEHSSLCYTGSPCHLFYVCVCMCVCVCACMCVCEALSNSLPLSTVSSCHKQRGSYYQLIGALATSPNPIFLSPWWLLPKQSHLAIWSLNLTVKTNWFRAEMCRHLKQT